MNSVPFERVVKRGQIYYIHKTPPYKGSREINPKNGRPAIIVSRDEDNYMSGTVMVVYLTSGSNVKILRETQFKLSAGKAIHSVAKCEQIATIDKQCIGDYICDISEEEIELLDRTLSVSLGIVVKDRATEDEIKDKINCAVAKQKDKNSMEVKMLYDHIKDLEAQCALFSKELEGRPSDAVVSRAQEEAKMYKKLYSDLLKTLAGKEI